MVTLLLTTPFVGAQNTAQAAELTECSAIRAPSATDLEPWFRASAWTNPLKAYVRGLYPAAATQFKSAWAKVNEELSSSFNTNDCNYEKVNRALDRRVFKAPPDAIPQEDRFGMPLPVAMAAGDAACRTGDLESAIEYLKPAAEAGNASALAALVTIESFIRPATAVARVTDIAASASPDVSAAGCLASIKAGQKNDVWCGKSRLEP